MILLGTLLLLLAGVPLWVRRWWREKHRRLLAEQLRESLRNMVQARGTGAGFQQALEHAASEGEMPLAGEWKQVLQGVRLGMSCAQALQELSERVRIPEMLSFISAVKVAQSSGGSMAGVLETLADTWQERHLLRQKIAALTAQGKASGGVLAALPFLLLGALSFIVPDLVRPLYVSTAGQTILAGMLISVCMGGFFIWRIVNVSLEAQQGLPEALDLMVLVLRAGLDFQTALAYYLESAVPGPLQAELTLLQSEIRTGSSRIKALQNLAMRTRDRHLRETARAVMQGMELGSSLAPVLQAQARAWRQARGFEAEKRASLAPLKLLVPLFVFIFPTIFAALFAPVILSVVKGGALT